MLGGKIVLGRTKRITNVTVGSNGFQAFHEKLNTMLGIDPECLMNSFGDVAPKNLAWYKVAGPIRVSLGRKPFYEVHGLIPIGTHVISWNIEYLNGDIGGICFSFKEAMWIFFE